MKGNNIKICDHVIPTNSHKTFELISTSLFTNTNVSIPVHVFNGKNKGPCLLVTAGIHGDELNGVEIIKQLTNSKKLKNLRGTLIAIPIMNIFGFIHMSRYLPDRRDLNRSFPGKSKGSLASKLAQVVNKDLVSKADYIIDLHTGAKHRFNFPQIRANLEDPETLKLGRDFAAPVLIQAEIRDGSLRSAGIKKKIPSLVYEAGEALRLDKTCVSLGLKGIFNVMQSIGMLSKLKNQKTDISPVIAKSMQWIRAPKSGIFYPHKKLGEIVKSGELVGIVSDPIGNNNCSVNAEQDGVVIGLLKLPLVIEGDALLNLACFSKISMAKNRFTNYDELIDL